MLMLTCGCCGAAFRGPRDPRHDKGFGTCKSCEKRIAEREENDWRKLTAKVAAALNEKNRAKFLAYDLELQRGILISMMDDGVIKWEISRARDTRADLHPLAVRRRDLDRDLREP